MAQDRPTRAADPHPRRASPGSCRTPGAAAPPARGFSLPRLPVL